MVVVVGTIRVLMVNQFIFELLCTGVCRHRPEEAEMKLFVRSAPAVNSKTFDFEVPPARGPRVANESAREAVDHFLRWPAQGHLWMNVFNGRARLLHASPRASCLASPGGRGSRPGPDTGRGGNGQVVPGTYRARRGHATVAQGHGTWAIHNGTFHGQNGHDSARISKNCMK